jgi:hypothetical protein
MGNVERRIIGSTIEFREVVPDEDKDGKPLPVLRGYAARFNTRSLPLGIMGFREEIDPQAFDESLAKNPDVRFTFNHNRTKFTVARKPARCDAGATITDFASRSPFRAITTPKGSPSRSSAAT